MYYKFYRRRYLIYVLTSILFVVIILNNNKPSDLDVSNRDQPVKKARNELRRSNERINMENYVEPEPCGNCPGENGKPVYLNVKYFKKEYTFILDIVLMLNLRIE
jgi:hypothetical protein